MDRRRARICIRLALALLACSGPAQAAAPTPIVDIRLRSESVEQEGLPADAEAITLRGRLGLQTSPVHRTTLLAEAELSWPLADRYNSTVNGKSGLPIVADPEGYEVNRLQLVNSSLPDTRIILGRQRILLDDQRFVGNSGWRQNEQTFDALRLINESVPQLSVDVTYLNQINRVFGRGSPVGRFHGDSLLANVSYGPSTARLTGFAYLLDLEEAPADSTRTLGARFAGSRRGGPIDAAYQLSYARQHDYAGNPLVLRSEMYSLELTATYRGFSVGAGREVLTGDGTKGFTTPLASLHAFQGWADKFLSTPPQGIDDRYLTTKYAVARIWGMEKLSVAARYHEFDAEQLPRELGSELDLHLRAEWKHLRAALKYAAYEAASYASDTKKLWAEVEFVW